MFFRMLTRGYDSSTEVEEVLFARGPANEHRISLQRKMRVAKCHGIGTLWRSNAAIENPMCIHTHIYRYVNIYIYTQLYSYIYIYIFMYMCVCGSSRIF